MFALNAVTFSVLKGAAIAVAAINAVALVAALVCLYLARRSAKKEETGKEQHASADSHK